MLQLTTLARSFGATPVLHAVDLHVAPGEIVGLLGANGAGKTTLLRIIVGLLRPDRGTVLVNGMIPVRGAVGYVPDTPTLYRYLTGREYLRFIGEIWDLPAERTAEVAVTLAAQLGLSDRLDALIETYSLGMRQKLALAGALLPDPLVLVLDEPFTGVDPLSARTIRAQIRAFAARGRAVVLSTHVLEIAQHLCTRVSVLSQGCLVASACPVESFEALEQFFLGSQEARYA
jgi:ABC-2 type transport system ATP-binding protein